MAELQTKEELNILQEEYVPLPLMISHLREAFDFPYKSVFSLRPYAKLMQENMKTACGYTRSALQPVISEYMKYTESEDFSFEAVSQEPMFKSMVSLVIPSMIHSDQLNFISQPFKKELKVATPKFDELFNDGKWELKVVPELVLGASQESFKQLVTFILNKFYNQNIDEGYSSILIFRNQETLIERYYQLLVKLDFVDVKVNGELPKLNVNNIEQDFDLNNFHEQFAKYIISFLNKPNLTVGEAIVDERNIYADQSLSLTGLTGNEFMAMDARRANLQGLYGKVFKEKDTVFCEDLSKIGGISTLVDRVIANGYKSLILHPLKDKTGKIQNVIEVGSKLALDFNALSVSKMGRMFALLDEAYLQFMELLEGQISNIIKENFTAIHPSVEWKFEDSAIQYFNEQIKGNIIDMPPIVFEELYPLYGQSDIVNSSVIRSEAIQEDMIRNLELVSNLISKWLDKRQIHILESFLIKTEKTLLRIREQFSSNDETEISNFLQSDVHPLLHQLHERHPELSSKAYKEYFSALDKDYGIYYQKRKSFEKSVKKLNNKIASFLEREDQKMQSVLSHYFEKYKTDGVEYNMYLGQSLLENNVFNKYDLQNFKMWQLTNMCEIVKLVRRLSPTLDIPLETAQLIFVYNQSLSIKFRMDEKKFDVDGSYNVRYEILKKRVDKAVINETGERLTVAGKIAIVYLNDADKTEYLGHLQYLQDKGYISPEIEDHQLGELQGADGLRALRVTVL